MFEFILLGKKKPLLIQKPSGLFVGGTNSLNTTDRYAYEDDTVLITTALTTGRSWFAGASNTTYAMFAYGATATLATGTSTTERYTFSNETSVINTMSGITCHQNSAAGNASLAYFTGGNVGGATRVHYYSDNTTYPGISLRQRRAYSCGAVGNTAVGIFAGGQDGGNILNTVDVIDYGSNTRGPGTNLGVATQGLTCAGNETFGLIIGGNAAASYRVDKYTYSTNARIAASALGLPRYYGCATGNNAQAVITGGDGAGAAVEIRKYADGTTRNGTAMTIVRNKSAAVSTSPGWVV